MIVGPGSYRGRELLEVATAAKRKAMKLPPREEATAYGLESEDFEESDTPEDEKTKPPRKERSKPGRSAEVKRKEHDLKRKPLKSPEPEWRRKGRGLPKDPDGRRGVLDAMLDEEGPVGALENENEEKLEALRERLGGGKEEAGPLRKSQCSVGCTGD